MSSSHRNPSGNWRAIQHDYDELNAIEPGENSYTLTNAQRWILLALCEYAGWKTRWYSSSLSSIDYDALDSMVTDMIYRLMSPIEGGGMFQLRQSSDDNCLLEQSMDGGETWIPAFDYGLCGNAAQQEYTSREGARNTNNQLWQGLYDGTPTSIHQDCPTVYDAGTGGELALCAAVKAYVDNQVLDTLNKYRVAAGLAAAGTGLLGATTIIGGIIGGVVLFLVAVALADVENLAADRGALDNVICDLKEALKGEDVTEANFQSAIAGLSGSTTNETTCVYILQGNAATQVNYLYFLDLLGEAQNAAAVGVVSCPCDDVWCYQFNFVSDGVGDWYAVPGRGYVMDYQAGVGIVGGQQVDTIAAPDIAYTGLWVGIDFPTSVLTFASVTYTIVRGSFDNAAPVCYLNAGGAVIINVSSTGHGDGQFTRTWEGTLSTDQLQLLLRASRDSSAPYSYSGSMVAMQVTLRGIGINPFGVDNC